MKASHCLFCKFLFRDSNHQSDSNWGWSLPNAVPCGWQSDKKQTFLTGKQERNTVQRDPLGYSTWNKKHSLPQNPQSLPILVRLYWNHATCRKKETKCTSRFYSRIQRKWIQNWLRNPLRGSSVMFLFYYFINFIYVFFFTPVGLRIIL